ncbi:hypothetical protein FR830_04755 [Klebsiella aerogenes]|nr:hypothetical protein FR830_04755 [Klebsiella aerogenes]
MPICNRVARIRCKPLSGNPPPVALTLTGATNRLPNRSPDKAQAAIRGVIRQPRSAINTFERR